MIYIQRGYEPGIPRSHPVMKGEATARTSEGEKGMSNADGIAVPVPERMLSTVWWRASMVKMEPAASRRTGSVRRVAPPR